MSEFRVARATVDEAPLAAAILREAALWLEATGQKNWEPEWFTPESMVPNAENGELWLAWDGPDPVGTMLVAATDEDFWPEDSPGEALYVHKLAVVRRAAGRGVSQALLQEAEAETKRLGTPKLKLDCRADRPKLRELYEAAGFQPVDERTVFGWLHVVRFEKSVLNDERVETILALLDEGWSPAASPMDFDASESHFRAAGQRMSVFCSEQHWVVFFEQVRYSVGEDAFEVALWAYGDCLSPECTDRYHGMSHARPFEFRAETTFLDPECQSWRHDRARFCIWRNGKQECFSPTAQEYAAAGIVFESPKTGPGSLEPDQLLQFLCHHLDHPFFASEDYLRRWIDSNIDFSVIPYPQVSVSHTLSLLLQTRHWHHPDLALSECPSQLESFHILARAIVTGDLTEWNRQERPLAVEVQGD